MVEKKKVPHLDLTLSTTDQPGATQLIKKAVKTGQAVNVLMTDIKAKTRRKHQEPQEGPKTTTSGPVDTEKLATAEPILLFTDADIDQTQQHDVKKALLTLWQDLDDVRQLHNVKVTMDTGGFAYGAYKATEYAQKRVAKAYKLLTGEDLP